ncbi:MAG TPA: alpha-amylase family glycosyl hydrolase, partial [Chthoniobacteraceae bacterium]|nr:alpha-amylase family glycosyl hydrolase [Chthoniobacteraceae bacterium]
MSPTRISFGQETIEVEYSAERIDHPDHAVFIALDFEMIGGSAQVPYGQGGEGSTVTLPIRADRIYTAHTAADGLRIGWRRWKQSQWSTRMDVKPEFVAKSAPGKVQISIRIEALGRPRPKTLNLCVWAKAMADHNGWGRLLPNPELGVRGGLNDQTIDQHHVIDLEKREARVQSRRGANAERVRIYQLLPRLFSNTNERRKPNGNIVQNGVGKFNDLTPTALAAIKELRCTHVWLTGIISQATATHYAELGLPPDAPDLLKGLAGSPYAVRDYFDVCPDYAINPAERLMEFEALVQRAHDAGLRVLIDFIPNHVARSYRSTVRPKLSFGRDDDATKFFDPRNNFYWLRKGDPGD